MKYKLKELPEIVYSSETKHLTIIDEEGKEYSISITDSSKHSEWLMWYEPGGWDEIIDVSILDYLEEEFEEHKGEFENIKRKEEEKKMDGAYDKYVQEVTEKKEEIKLDDLISELSIVQDYRTKDYYERFYHAYHHAKKKLKL